VARLTNLSIANLKASKVRREVPDPGQRGLYVVVQPGTQAKSYAVRYRFGGRSRKLTLGAGLDLAAARKLAADALYQVSQGRDPGSLKQAQKDAAKAAAADTLAAVAEEYFKREGSKRRNAAAQQSILTRLVLPTLGKRPIGEIRRKDIMRLLDRIADENGAAQSDATLALIRVIMNWFALRDEDFRSPIVKGMRRHKPSEHARSRILTDDELCAIWRIADADPGPFGAYIKFLLLTAARRNEAAHMRRSEIVGTDWTLPASRNKTKVDLVRPLSAAALALIARAPRIHTSDFVFSVDGRRFGGLSRRKIPFDKASGVTGWTLHDLRRTARSLMSRVGVPSHHAERCLGHVVGGVEGVYDRHDYRPEMLIAYEKLATLIQQIVNPQPNVVAMARS
jgi:integrase